MNYTEALAYIHNTLKFGSKLGLHNIGKLLELMGNPQDKLSFVHIAGTNGKGSTAAFISSILSASGYRTGTFTSPYIERFTERIKINDSEIDEQSLARITAYVKGKVDVMLEQGENHPTEFEIVTAIGFQYFYECACEIVVLEVGLGGRFDSTNIIKTPLVSVITTISLDHMDILGSTLEQIAFEKAGIIKDGGRVVCYPQDEEAYRVIQEKCLQTDSILEVVGVSDIKIIEFGVDGQTFDWKKFKSLQISLLGQHQCKNAAISIKAAETLMNLGYERITEHTIRQGLMGARWAGRFEVLKKNPVFLIDGAHNPEGVEVLAANLSTYFPGKKIIFIMGVLKDKDYTSMVKAVVPLANAFITITPDNSRALPAQELSLFIKSYCNNVVINDKIETAIGQALRMASSEDVICAFGSLYFIGDIRKSLAHTSMEKL